MERPDLKRLLADVAVGKVDVVVLYKIDRLTRSLADFSRIVDVLDKAGASFVSVSQSFKTTTSMGRLMLNVLLSFAQFEREVAGERIRDKIAASKKKGIWMGGPVPLGYEVRERKLVIKNAEARTVQHIFHRYAELGSGQALVDELRQDGTSIKRRPYKDGSVRGGVPFTRGPLFHLLANRVYLGEVVHKGTAYPGEHPAIISATVWEQAQQRITENRVGRKLRRKARNASLLAGLIYDGLGRRMTPSHTVRSGKRYRYYVTHPSEVQRDGAVWRLPAHAIEKAVTHRLTEFLEDSSAIRRLVGSDDAEGLAGALSRCRTAAGSVRASTLQRRTTVPMLIERVDVDDGLVRLTLSSSGLAKLLGISAACEDMPNLTVQAMRIRKGSEVKLVIADASQAERDEGLVALLRQAMAVREEVLAAPERTIADLATATARRRKRLAKLLTISWLSPDSVSAILAGSQPTKLTTRCLLGASLPFDWARQRSLLGFG